MMMLDIRIVETTQDVPNYHKDHPDWKPLDFEKVIVVVGGTMSGQATVDFQLKDSGGNMYVAMLTGNLVKSLAASIRTAEVRSQRPEDNAQFHQEPRGTP